MIAIVALTTMIDLFIMSQVLGHQTVLPVNPRTFAVPRKNETRLTQSLIAASSSPSAQLLQILLERMVTGVNPVGSKLPSVREIADSLGVNRNTASKVYRQLAREGITRSVAGSGVFVQTVPDAGTIETMGRSQLSLALAELARRGRLFGLSRASFSDLVTQTLDQVYRSRTIAFVECNRLDTLELARDLGLFLGEKVEPVVLADVQQHAETVARTFDLICTTFYHVAEIKDLMAQARDKIFALQTTPRAEALLQLTQFTAQQCLGIVVSNQRTLESVKRTVQLYCPAAIDAVVISPDQNKLSFTRKVDAIVDTLSTHEYVARRVKGVPNITIIYHVDSQSLDLVRRRLTQMAALEGGGRASAP